MRHDARRAMLGFLTTLRIWRASLLATVAAKWGLVSRQERIRVRNHGLAVTVIAVVTILSLASGLQAAGPLIVVDLVIAAAAWFGGLSVAAAAALTAVLVTRVTTIPLVGTPLAASLAVLVLAKWLIVATAVAALSARVREDGQRISGLEGRIQALQADARQTLQNLREREAASANTHAQLRDDANLARQQLTTLQSVTDPALNVFSGAKLVSSLLDRLRAAIDADGVAIYHHQGVRGGVVSATSGIAPSGNVRRAQPAGGYQTGRTALIHNDAERVAETSLCQWPRDVASLILVPVVHADRLQLVVEVVNRRARRSTEWELALIQVVAERAAGVLRPDATFDTGAVA